MHVLDSFNFKGVLRKTEKGQELVPSPFIHYSKICLKNNFFIKFSTIWPSLVIKLNVLLEIFEKVYFVFRLKHLMTSQICVFISFLFLNYIISNAQQGIQVNTKTNTP